VIRRELCAEKERIERNKQSIQSMIDILSAERARFVEEEAHQRAIEEQTKNLKMQGRAIAYKRRSLSQTSSLTLKEQKRYFGR
jgi:hypothetical protein